MLYILDLFSADIILFDATTNCTNFFKHVSTFHINANSSFFPSSFFSPPFVCEQTVFILLCLLYLHVVWKREWEIKFSCYCYVFAIVTMTCFQRQPFWTHQMGISSGVYVTFEFFGVSLFEETWIGIPASKSRIFVSGNRIFSKVSGTCCFVIDPNDDDVHHWKLQFISSKK